MLLYGEILSQYSNVIPHVSSMIEWMNELSLVTSRASFRDTYVAKEKQWKAKQPASVTRDPPPPAVRCAQVFGYGPPTRDAKEKEEKPGVLPLPYLQSRCPKFGVRAMEQNVGARHLGSSAEPTPIIRPLADPLEVDRRPPMPCTDLRRAHLR